MTALFCSSSNWSERRRNGWLALGCDAEGCVIIAASKAAFRFFWLGPGARALASGRG